MKPRASIKWKMGLHLSCRQRLSEQGALHSCCTVILSTTDPMYLRKEVGFEKVSDYPHLDGALYRQVIAENKFVGSIAIYLVVLNTLPIDPKNASLLLLSKGKKQSEFCRWLLEGGEGITIQEKLFYQFYLLRYNLIQNQEVMQKMRRTLSERNLHLKDLVSIFKTESIAKAVLNGHRKLTASHIEKLAEFFRLPYDLFFEPFRNSHKAPTWPSP